MKVPHMSEKARRYVGLSLIDRVPGGYLLRALPGNHEDHFVWIEKDGFHCDCQGYKYRGTCSHIEAVKLYLQNLRMRV